MIIVLIYKFMLFGPRIRDFGVHITWYIFFIVHKLPHKFPRQFQGEQHLIIAFYGP